MSGWSPLFRALEALEMTYVVRHTPRGIPYAGFQYGHRGTLFRRPRLASFTALEDQGTIRLTVHELRPSLANGDLPRFNYVLPIGRIYVSPHAGQPELALGLYGGEGFEGVHLRALLDYLLAAKAFCEARGKNASLERPRIAGPELSSKELVATMSALGEATTEATWESEVRSEAGHRLALRSSLEGGWLSCRASYVPPRTWNPKWLELFFRLQDWAPVGRFEVDEDGSFIASVSTPLVDHDLHAIEWTRRQAILMLDAAAKHLAKTP